MNRDRANKTTKVQKLSQAAKDSLSALADLASKGDKAAAAQLCSVAALGTQWLNWLVSKRPEMFRPMAEVRFAWPVMHSSHPERVRKVDKVIKQIRLGIQTGVNLSPVGKSFSWEKPANIIAFHLYQLAQLVRSRRITSLRRTDFKSIDLSPLAALGVGWSSPNVHSYDDKYVEQLQALENWGPGSQLPALSKSTAKQWVAETGELFRIVFGDEFDTHHRLQELRASVLGSAQGGGPSTIRSLMLKRVKQALSSIAPVE